MNLILTQEMLMILIKMNRKMNEFHHLIRVTVDCVKAPPVCEPSTPLDLRLEGSVNYHNFSYRPRSIGPTSTAWR